MSNSQRKISSRTITTVDKNIAKVGFAASSEGFLVNLEIDKFILKSHV